MAIRWVTNDASGRAGRTAGIRAGGSTGTRAPLETGSAEAGLAAAPACRACELGPVVDAILDTIITWLPVSFWDAKRLLDKTSQGPCRMWLAGRYLLSNTDNQAVCRIVQEVGLG